MRGAGPENDEGTLLAEDERAGDRIQEGGRAGPHAAEQQRDTANERGARRAKSERATERSDD